MNASNPEDLFGVARRLWPEPARIDLTRRTPGAAEGARDWLVLPSVNRPWLLLPAASPSAAGTLLRDDHGQRSPRLLRALASLHRRKLLARLPLSRLRVSDADESDSIEVELHRILGTSSALVVRLGRRRWNRSVVLRPLDAAGDTLAFVKSAASPTGAEALRRERDNLRRVAELGPRLVEWPEVMHHGCWRGLELLALSPLIGDKSATPRTKPPTASMRALALAADNGSHALGESAACQRWIPGAWELTSSAQRDQLIDGVDTVVSRLGDVDVPIGCWHGDWVPWNMTWHGDRVLLWDWEHFDEGVPVGFDGIHYRAQQLRMTNGTDRAAEDLWVRDATEWLLDTFQLELRQIRAVVLAYLLEINLRYLRDRADDPRGIPPRDGWGLPLLGRLATEWN
ncbi:MAG TPA: hypothetical protein VEX15_02255 [Nocardioidaceae bacterium]|nr:hypothetical protein [Nocardioidaceae bacterium]